MGILTQKDKKGLKSKPARFNDYTESKFVMEKVEIDAVSETGLTDASTDSVGTRQIKRGTRERKETAHKLEGRPLSLANNVWEDIFGTNGYGVPSLTKINVSGMKFRPGDVNALLFALRSNAYVTDLDMTNVNFEGDGYIQSDDLAGMLKANRSITKLTLAENKLDHLAAEAIGRALQVNNYLRYLDLSSNRMGSANRKNGYPGIEAIARALAPPGMYGNMRPSDKKMRKIRRNRDELYDGVWKCLDTLYLSANGLLREDMEVLGSGLIWNDKMKFLTLDENRFGQMGFAHLQKMLVRSESLEYLGIAGCQIGLSLPGGEHRGTELMKYSLFAYHITVLDLRSNMLIKPDAERLGAGLQRCRHLEKIYLSNNTFGPGGAVGIAQALRRRTDWMGEPSLEVLDLEDTQIGVEDVEALSDALIDNMKLVELRLGSHPLGDAMCDAIAPALAKNGKLVSLSLRKCEITLVGAITLGEALSANQANSRLETLGMEDNRITTMETINFAQIFEAVPALHAIDFVFTNHFVEVPLRYGIGLGSTMARHLESKFRSYNQDGVFNLRPVYD